MLSLAWSTSDGQPQRTRSSWVRQPPQRAMLLPSAASSILHGPVAHGQAVQHKPAELQQKCCFSCCAGYRKACLEHHPDKAGAATADEKTKAAIEDNFKLIQEAYDTLSDPQRRREFDSVDDFDDSLPFDCAAADFFKVRAAPPVRAKWSTCLPCMGLQHHPQLVTGRAE